MTFAEPTRHTVRIVVSREQAMQAMTYACAHDVERGGMYDARSAAILVWSHNWSTPELRQASEIVGSIYLAWHTPHPDLATITELHVEAGYALADVERHLELLFGGV
jgi:hypothetical protein